MKLDRVRIGTQEYKYKVNNRDMEAEGYKPAEMKTHVPEEYINRYKEKVLNDAIAKLKDAANIFSRRLSFSVDKETNRVIVKVIDTETDKVIKEIPPEQVIELAAKIQKMIGLLVDEER